MNLANMLVRSSSDPAEIVAVTRRSAETKDIIRIIELSNMGEIMPRAEAEHIRAQLLANKVRVRQLTNATQFAPWTDVAGFIKTCMSIRRLDATQLPIQTELLVFDATVALYRLAPEPWMVVIEDELFAAEQKALFDLAWEQATPLAVQADGSTR